MKIGYIVSCYLGARRVENSAYTSDRFFYLKKQLDQLNSISHSLNEIIFVFNLREEDYPLLHEAVDLVSKHPTSKTHNTTIMTRANSGFSYGAWDFALKEIGGKFDYCLLIEDDFVAYVNDFDKKFLSYFGEENIFFVCQLYSNVIIGKKHCAISNGMINNKIFNDYYKKNKVGFDLKLDDDYSAAEHNQVCFMDKFIEKGSLVKDITDKYYVPYVNFKKILVDYGQKDAEALIVPIWPPFFT